MAKKKVVKPHVIRVTASQVIRYDQTLELTDKEWLKWQEMQKGADDNGEEREFGQFVMDWLDLSNVWDADDIEDVNIEKLDNKE